MVSHNQVKSPSALAQVLPTKVRAEARGDVLPEHVPSAAETFASMSFDDMWQEAFMSDVCHYLRGGVYLKVPPSFSGLLPKRL